MSKSILITLPVYNEEDKLEKSTKKIVELLSGRYDFRILIVDNGSSDGTVDKAKELSAKYPQVGFIHLDEKGRGRALRKAWTGNGAEVYCYMDIDLSTDLSKFAELVSALDEGYDIAIGSRHARGAEVKRSLRREILSRGYNILLKLFFGVGFRDAQCGFKAVSRRVVSEIVPLVKDEEWFFDTEMLIRAEHRGLRIKEIAVRWDEGRESKVDILRTVFDYVGDIVRLRLNI